MTKLPALITAVGLIVTMVPAVEKCAGADTEIYRTVYKCEGNGCNDDPNKGNTRQYRCSSWCCPGLNGVQYDSTTCYGETSPDVCCAAYSDPWVLPGYHCTTVGPG